MRHLHGLYFEIFPRITLAELQLLKDVSRNQDSSAYQGPDFSFYHAMSDGRIANTAVARALAQTAYEGFKRMNLARAKLAAASNNRQEALRYIGQSLHAIADNTSPSHEGFQPWPDLFSVVQLFHFAGQFQPASSWGYAGYHISRELLIDATSYGMAIEDMRDYFLSFEPSIPNARDRFGLNFGDISRIVARERARYNAPAELLSH
jgi:hypothetical protein